MSLVTAVVPAVVPTVPSSEPREPRPSPLGTDLGMQLSRPRKRLTNPCPWRKTALPFTGVTANKGNDLPHEALQNKYPEKALTPGIDSDQCQASVPRGEVQSNKGRDGA